MDWPSGASGGDAVIVRQEPSSGSRFVVHGSHGAQLACSTYAEAEAQAASYAEHARACVWYLEEERLQIVCSFVGVPARARDRLRREALMPDPPITIAGRGAELVTRGKGARIMKGSRSDDQRREDLSAGNGSGRSRQKHVGG